MLRWVALVLLVACDKGPIASHSIHYEIGRALAVEVNFEKNSLDASVNGKASRRTLDAATTKSLADLAACAAKEEQPPDFEYMSGASELVLNIEDKTTRIELSHPFAGRCTSSLESSLETLVGWRD